MPIIQASIKHAKQSLVRAKRRIAYKTRMKTYMRKVSDLAKAGKQDEAAKQLAQAFKAIDIASKKNIIHWKNAARKKSLLSRMVAVKK